MTAGGKTKALCVATRCETADQFVDSFHRFCDETSFFVATLNMRPAGLETPFSIQLADRTPMLRGMCVVLEAWSTPANPYQRPGIRLGIEWLTPDSEALFARLQIRRACAGVEGAVAPTPTPTPTPTLAAPRPAAPAPTPTRAAPPATSVAHALPSVIVDPARTPGSELVLPANPLMNLTDESLEGFVDCTLYEETGTFFRADDPAAPAAAELDPVIPPPPVATSLATPVPPFARMFPGERMARARSPAPGRPRRWWMVAVTAVAAAAAVLVLVSRSGSSSADPPAARAAAAPPRTPAAAATPPSAAVVAADDEITRVTPKVTPKVAPKITPEIRPEATIEPDGEVAVAPTGAPIAGDGPCQLDITTTPAGTRVSLDQKVIGPSPISIQGPCERRRVDLVHPRYKPVMEWVTLTPGAPHALDVTLIRPTHTLSVSTIPSGATISIGGRRAGTSPSVVKLMGFSGIEVTISKPGFKPVTRRIYSKVAADKLTVALERKSTFKW